jgi:hypothetical protein
MTVPTQNLLPLPSLQFFDANGLPLALGFVYCYANDGLTPKDTYQDPDGLVLNSNPIELDAAGRAIVYGLGEYVWRVMDALGNVQYTQPTADPTDILQISSVIWPFLRAQTTAAALAVIGGAPLDSPAFTGVPTAPTALATTNTTQIATTEYVKNVVYPLAPLASPALTGVPTAPTAASGTNTTQLATTAFVTTAIGSGAAVFGALTDQKANRVIGTTYTNSGGTARYITVVLIAPAGDPSAYVSSAAITVGTITINGTFTQIAPSNLGLQANITMVIPAGATYSVASSSWNGFAFVNSTISTWFEVQ